MVVINDHSTTQLGLQSLSSETNFGKMAEPDWKIKSVL